MASQLCFADFSKGEIPVFETFTPNLCSKRRVRNNYSVWVITAMQQSVLGDKKTNFLLQEKADSCLVFSTLNFILQLWETQSLICHFAQLQIKTLCLGKKKKQQNSCYFTDFAFTSDIWSKCIWQVILGHFLHYNIQLTLDFICGCSDKLTFWLNWHLPRSISEFSTNCMHISEAVLVSRFGGGAVTLIVCIN